MLCGRFCWDDLCFALIVFYSRGLVVTGLCTLSFGCCGFVCLRLRAVM